MKKAIIIFALIFSTTFVFSETEAATTTTMYVNAKSDIILRAQPKQNAEKIGTVKNHSKVTVLSSSKGFSYIQSGDKKGYVYSSALTKKNPKATPVTGALTPKEGLRLTYSPLFGTNEKYTFEVKKDADITYINDVANEYHYYMYYEAVYENRKLFGLAMGESDWVVFILGIPFKQGSYTEFPYSESPISDTVFKKALVESTTKTIKVKAGTFKNVVIIRYDNGSRIYFAKGIGVIKETDGNGNITTELVSVK
ncbi:SH3 domain-containing protein [Ureibacillus xyleni]|uniref:SH3 domain-containing protein n=1 Tax=Ureibacillus xyleni TaxID=614648 RepID=A0A285T1K3_9BACL|nr:SH3 domain-containing protein [Ureibacillus xyleni]SOC15144.1 SH3 domain-containing protein [Ureibacillus xyleni]